VAAGAEVSFDYRTLLKKYLYLIAANDGEAYLDRRGVFAREAGITKEEFAELKKIYAEEITEW
jgi:hypothetical protein